MSLKLRLVLIPSVILALGLAATIAYEMAWAPARVRAEVRSGMRLGRVLVMAALADARATGSPEAAMRELAAELPEARHVVFHIVTGPQQVAVEELPRLDAAASSGTPLWFARFFDLTPRMRLFPIVVGGTEVGQVAMLSNPLDEIGEIWNELARLAAILLVASAAIIALILWTVRSALKPVRELQHGFDRLERGDYAARLRPIAVPELRRIGEQFNSLARSLGEVTEDNHRLIDALITLQEAERKEIAHELHDEFGPALFGIRAEATSILENCRRGVASLAPIAERAEAIGGLVDGIQRTNARILARLRPLALEALGLAEALRNLVASWQERCPEVAFCVRAEAPFAGDEAAEIALYRVAQECVVNAIRHAGPQHVEVCLEHADGAVRLVVRDDGRGLPAGLRLGFGLMGMTERVRALHGSLAINNAACGGTEIAATIPLAAALPA